MTMLRRHIMMDDAGWEAQKARMRANTAQALVEGAYGYAVRARSPHVVVAHDPNSCPQFCPECHGENIVLFDENGTTYARPCSRYEARRANGSGR